MTQDDASSSSKCIGNPVTPVCAVETFMACWLRPGPDLCRIAGVERDRAFDGSSAYRIVRQEVLTGQSPDLPFRFDKSDLIAGDVRIDILEERFSEKEPPDSCCHYWNRYPDVYIVRRQDGRWTVIFKGPPVDTRMLVE